MLVVSVFLLVGVAVGQPCRAQDLSRATDTIFTNPGARSIGLGGAFAAIADDATASFANPAGLVQILRPEVSAEVRATASRADDSSPYDLTNSLSGLGFFSFVYPSSKWAVSLYTHQYASVGFMIVDPINPTREFTVRSFAAAAAWKISEHLSLGAGLGYFNGDRSPAVGASGISDTDWAVNTGVLWKPKPTWRVAGFYRQGPEFQTTAGSVLRAPAPLRTNSAKALATATKFTFPDEYGAGVAWQPRPGAFTFGFEWDRVGSSIDPLSDGQVTTKSGSEYHLGAEYAVLRWKPVVAFRAGFWREPGRTQEVEYFLGRQTIDVTSSNHVALGFGLAFRRFQIDAGVDIWRRAVVGSVSLVYSF